MNTAFSTSDRGFVETIADWRRNRSAVFAFQLSKPDEQNKDEGDQQLLVFRRELGKGTIDWRELLGIMKTAHPQGFICAPLCDFFNLGTENTQMSIGLCRLVVTCHMRLRWVERNFSAAVSCLHICLLQHRHDSLQTSSFLVPSLPWNPLSIVLCCHWDILISCSASTSLTHKKRQGKCACLCGQGLASTACILTLPKKVYVTLVAECFGSA